MNADGTKNKSVTIKAAPSNDPYSCVASGFLGSPEYNKSVDIFINRPSTRTTTLGTITQTKTDPSTHERNSLTGEYILFKYGRIII